MKKVLFYIVLLFGVLFIIVLYSPKYSPNFYNGYNSGYRIEAGVNYQNINLGSVSTNSTVLKPDGLIVSNSVDNDVFDYDYDFNNNVLISNSPVSNGGVVLTSTNSYNNTNRDINPTFNNIMLPLTSIESEYGDDISTPLFSQQLPSNKMMKNNGQGIENNNGDNHGNGHGWGRDGNEGNGKGNGGDYNNVPLNDDLFVLLILSTIYIVLKYLKIVK